MSGANGGDPDLRDAAIRDQQKLLGYALVNTWPEFVSAIKQWEVKNDPTDPKDLDEKAFLDRRMIWGRGLGQTMLIELNMPFEMFEALLTMLQPIYDKMRADDWKAAYGDQPLPDDGSFIDLGRSDRQRWPVTRVGKTRHVSERQRRKVLSERSERR